MTCIFQLERNGYVMENLKNEKNFGISLDTGGTIVGLEMGRNVVELMLWKIVLREAEKGGRNEDCLI